MMGKPKNPYPKLIRRVLKKILPDRYYYKYIGRKEVISLLIWRKLAELIEHPMVILDVGAYMGEYAIAARRTNPMVPIYAFEPNPDNAKRLANNCEGFGISVEQIAISEADSDIIFEMSDATSHIISMGSDLTQNVITIPARCLNSWVKKNQVLPGLIKIDTEGAESGILRGAKQCLLVNNPIILCEVLTDEAGSEVMTALPSNYCYYYINEWKGIEERSVVNRKEWRNHNWLLVPESKKHIIEMIGRNLSL